MQQVLVDRYELRSRIGVGGAAQVFLAGDRVLGRDVAVKVLHPETAADPLFVERFKREARAAAALNHPNIVYIYDWGSVDDTYYMVMEYVPGTDLKTRLQDGSLPEKEALDVAAQVSDALEAAHQRGIVHRDVKPHNILLAPGGRVKVTDFGIARATGLSQLTKTNVVTGTAHYISPEQVQRKELDGRSDIYSLGVVLYEMLIGREPFRGDSLVELALQHVHDAPTPPRRLKPELSRETESVVLKALAKEPRKRYQTAAELRYALQHARDQLLAEPGKTTRSATAVAADRTSQLAPLRTPEVRERALARPARAVDPDRRRSLAWLMAVPVLLVALLVAGSLLVFGRGVGSKHAANGRATATSVPTTRRPTPGPQRSPTAGVKAPALRPKPRPPATASASSPTPPPTSVPPAPTTQPTVVAALNPSGGNPKGAVTSFYSFITAGRLGQAEHMWSDHMKSVWNPESAIWERFSHTQLMTILGMDLLREDSHRATVSVTVRDQERSESSPYSGTYNLTWSLVNNGSGWLLDDVSS